MNPYQVLGVDPKASDDEVKKAYRTLSRKYHPDSNVNNPNRDQAEERFKEVQQAYENIMKLRQRGYDGPSAGQSGAFGSYGGFGGWQGAGAGTQSKTAAFLREAADHISRREFTEAMHVLNGIPLSERNGIWYYYSAVTSEGMGNFAKALEHIERAITLEPGNMQYRQFRQYLSRGSAWYNGDGKGGYGSGRDRHYERPYAGYSYCWLGLFALNAIWYCCC